MNLLKDVMDTVYDLQASDKRREKKMIINNYFMLSL
jgi:hypothetical protein